MSTAQLSDLCINHSLPQPLYDLEAVGSSYTMCCMVGRFKETSSDMDKMEAKNKAAAKGNLLNEFFKKSSLKILILPNL